MDKTIRECIEYMYDNNLIDGVNYDCLINQLDNLDLITSFYNDNAFDLLGLLELLDSITKLEDIQDLKDTRELYNFYDVYEDFKKLYMEVDEV